ncbi:MAG: hypothetical protein J6B85_04195 [Lachnospiraceae bacterium]|nr:hypothetical protein [Lachnospiraceae bacterium]
MREIWLLTKMAFGSVLPLNRRSGKKWTGSRKDGGRGNVVWILIVLCGIGIMALSALYSVSMGMVFGMADCLSLLPVMYVVIMSIMILVTTIYKVKGTLFGFQDYDLVMSLPVPAWKITASRLLILYLFNLMITVAVVLPANVVYGIMAKEGPLYYGISIVLLIFIPAVPMVIGTAVGILIALLASRFRKSNLIQLLLLTLVTIVPLLLSLSITGSEEAEMLAAVSGMGNMLQRIYPPGILYGKAIGGDFSAMAGFILTAAAAYGLFAVGCGALFRKLNTQLLTVRTRSDYRFEEKQEKGTPFLALYRKEFRRLLASPLYLFNTCFGIVMITAAAIACLFVKPEQLLALLELPEVGENMAIMMAGFICVLAGTISTSSCSVSLEGKNLWILKCAPIPAKVIFAAKIAVNLSVSVPFLIVDGIVFALILKAGAVQTFFLLALPIAYAVFTAFFGLLANLRFPVLDWKSETVVVKQSAASMCGILVGMVGGIIPVGLVIAMPGVNPYQLYLGVLAGLILAIVLIWKYLLGKGVKRWEQL